MFSNIHNNNVPTILLTIHTIRKLSSNSVNYYVNNPFIIKKWYLIPQFFKIMVITFTKPFSIAQFPAIVKLLYNYFVT